MYYIYYNNKLNLPLEAAAGLWSRVSWEIYSIGPCIVHVCPLSDIIYNTDLNIIKEKKYSIKHKGYG